LIDPTIKDDGPAITGRLLRQFAALWLAAFGGLAIWNALVVERPGLAITFAVVAVSVGITGLIRPFAVRMIFLAAMAATMPIGRVVSFVLLAVLYYLVFTPIGLVFRVKGRDALARRRDDRRLTHWVEREQASDPRRYLHQA
jgi:hypothetical protein